MNLRLDELLQIYFSGKLGVQVRDQSQDNFLYLSSSSVLFWSYYIWDN